MAFPPIHFKHVSSGVLAKISSGADVPISENRAFQVGGARALKGPRVQLHRGGDFRANLIA